MSITNFPMVSQRTTVTSDGRPSENALYDCVAASIGAIMLWLEGKSAWDDTINPDLLKDKAYGEAYANAGTDAARYVDVCNSMGFHLYSEPMYNLSTVRQLLASNKPVIFTELDPYVDTNLSQYSGWTHVAVWFAGDSTGLTAMDPFIAQPVYKSDATWQSLLRANQVWMVEKNMSLPQGWSWDSTTKTLHTPGADIVLGFAAHVYQKLLAGQWEASDYPDKPQYYVTKLEASNPDLGDGDQLMTRKHLLGYPHNPVNAVASLKNTVIEEYVGTELEYTRNQYAALYGAYQKLKAQPTPAPTPAPVPAPDTQMQAELTQVQQELAAANAKVEKLTALAQEMILESVA